MVAAAMLLVSATVPMSLAYISPLKIFQVEALVAWTRIYQVWLSPYWLAARISPSDPVTVDL